jgi:transposase-like protein
MIRFNAGQTVGQCPSETMKAELAHFLGRNRNVRGTGKPNHRNGSFNRDLTLKGVGEVRVNVPRDRNGDFQTRVNPRGKQFGEEISRDLSLPFLSRVSPLSLSMISLRLLGRKVSPAH